MLWALVAIGPLLLYPWRSRLPRIWSRIGYEEKGSGYTGLAMLNAIIVAIFVIQEIQYGLKDKSFEYVNSLNSPQLSNQNRNFLITGVLDYLFMTITLATLVYRNSPGIVWLAVLTLVVPPVGFPLFMANMSRRGGQRLGSNGGKIE